MPRGGDSGTVGRIRTTGVRGALLRESTLRAPYPCSGCRSTKFSRRPIGDFAESYGACARAESMIGRNCDASDPNPSITIGRIRRAGIPHTPRIEPVDCARSSGPITALPRRKLRDRLGSPCPDKGARGFSEKIPRKLRTPPDVTNRPLGPTGARWADMGASGEIRSFRGLSPQSPHVAPFIQARVAAPLTFRGVF